MSRLVWNELGQRLYETGIDRGVLYPLAGPGVPWSGIVSVNESIMGGDAEALYFDGVKYRDIVANEDFQATIEAFYAPAEFDLCDGSKSLAPGLYATQQPRQMFGLSYRTLIGNDLLETDYGYKLHIVYGATASPAARANSSLGESPRPNTRSWVVNTVPPVSSLHKPTAHFVIDSTIMDPYLLQEIESVLYGTDSTDPLLLSQNAILDILANEITEPLSEPI